MTKHGAGARGAMFEKKSRRVEHEVLSRSGERGVVVEMVELSPDQSRARPNRDRFRRTRGSSGAASEMWARRLCALLLKLQRLDVVPEQVKTSSVVSVGQI